MTRIEWIRHGIQYLRLARRDFQMAKAPRTLAKISSSIKSAEGALRHAIGQDAEKNANGYIRIPGA